MIDKMTKKRGLILLMAFAVVGSVFAGAIAGGALASETDAFNGNQVDSADNVNKTGIWVDSNGNTTVNMTEDHQITAGGSFFMNTSYTPASASINGSTGSGTLAVNVVDGGVYVNETGGTSSANLTELHIVFNYSSDPGNMTGDVPDAINTSSEMDTLKNLSWDDDKSEVHEYQVLQSAFKKTVEVKGLDSKVDNGTVELNESGDGYVVVNLERRNGTNVSYDEWNYEGDVKVMLDLNESHFDNMERVDEGEFGRIVHLKKDTSDGTFNYSIQNPDNISDSYTLNISVTANADSSDDNSTTVSVTSREDLNGSLQSDRAKSYGISAAGLTSGQAISDIANVPLELFAVGLVIVVALLYWLFIRSRRRRGQGLMSDMRDMSPIGWVGIGVLFLVLAHFLGLFIGAPVDVVYNMVGTIVSGFVDYTPFVGTVVGASLAAVGAGLVYYDDANMR